MSTFDERPRYLQPDWPDEPFLLESITGEGTLGPFNPEDWVSTPDGTLYYSDGSHPVTLRIRGWRILPEGVLIDANDGDLGPMTFRLWTLRRQMDVLSPKEERSAQLIDMDGVP